MKKIIFLVADKNMEFLMRGLLPRIPVVEHIESFEFERFIHPYRDPGVFQEAHEFLRSFSSTFNHAVVMLDRMGSGQEAMPRQEIEHTLEQRLSKTGWGNERACALCIDPEIENWVWVAGARMQAAIGWADTKGIYDWLHENTLKQPGDIKPTQPKEAFESALRYCKTPRSSSIYKQIAAEASYKNCQDEAFLKMLKCLKLWLSA